MEDGVVGDEKGFGLGMFLNKRERCRRMFLCGCRWKVVVDGGSCFGLVGWFVGI